MLVEFSWILTREVQLRVVAQDYTLDLWASDITIHISRLNSGSGTLNDPNSKLKPCGALSTVV